MKLLSQEESDKEIELLLVFSSMWTYESNMNYSVLYELLRNFFHSIEWYDIPWITELDRNNTLFRIYRMMWSISLEIKWLLNWNDVVSNTSKDYDSEICVSLN